MNHVVDKVREFTELVGVIFFYLKRVLVVLSVILLVRHSIGYYQKYYIDVRHDNMVIDRNIKKLWRRGIFAKLTPLRNWERNDDPGFQVMLKLTWAEWFGFIKKIWPTIMFVVQATFFVLLDYGLAALLQEICDRGAYEVNFSGLEHLSVMTPDLEFEWSVKNFKVRRMAGNTQFTIDLLDVKFPLSDLNEFVIQTKPCLPWPTYTSWELRACLVAIILSVCLTHILEMYLSRASSMICNFFHASRADERANDLYERIASGREARRRNLSQIVMLEVRKRRRAKRLSLLPYLMKKLRLRKWLPKWMSKLTKKLDKENSRCPGCGWKLKNKKKSKHQGDVSDNASQGDVEEQREEQTKTQRRRSRALSISSFEDDHPLRKSISVGSVMQHLEVSGDSKYKRNLPRDPSWDRSVPVGEPLARGFLTSLICPDCMKDAAEPPDEFMNDDAHASPANKEPVSKPKNSPEESNSIISDQNSLKHLITGMWRQ
jgi:hypothetical protein